MAYIKSISEKASKFGICKIIPPESWNPDFAIDTEVRPDASSAK
jgi:histone demethylase JARID1